MYEYAGNSRLSGRKPGVPAGAIRLCFQCAHHRDGLSGSGIPAGSERKRIEPSRWKAPFIVQKRLGYAEAERVAGPDLMEEMFARSENGGYRHYFYGSSPETIRN